MVFIISSLVKTPDCRHNCFPFWNKIMVGTPRTWYFEANSWFLSTSILNIATRSPKLSFTCFKIGASILQGPHQVAEKSINTGFSDFIILSKLLLIFKVFIVGNCATIWSTTQIKNHLKYKKQTKSNKKPLLSCIGLNKQKKCKCQS